MFYAPRNASADDWSAPHVSLTCGNYTERLSALRDLLAVRLENASARDVAPIARQLADVDARLEALSIPEESDQVDEIAQRRAARRADAAVLEPS